MLLYCGGGKLPDDYFVGDPNYYVELLTSHLCYAVEVNPDGVPKVTKAASLPYDVTGPCHGSDGEKLVLAGGQSLSSGAYHNEIIVLEGLNDRWSNFTGKLGGLRAGQAGVLVDNVLICLGGVEDTVGLSKQVTLAAFCCTLLVTLKREAKHSCC